jgi:excisionase family DNA binding protein
MPSSSEGNRSDQPDFEDLIALPQAAEICGLSHSHLRKLVREGEIWGVKMGRDWHTTEQAVREYLARNLRPGTVSKKNWLTISIAIFDPAD